MTKHIARILLVGALLIAACATASAQDRGNVICPTAAPGTSDNRCASTAFVQSAIPLVGITGLTGDGTATGPGVVPFTLATVNANVGTFGSATQCVTTAVNAKGLITAISATTCVPSLTIGSTAIAGGTNSYILFNNAGFVGNEQFVPLANGGLGASQSAATANQVPVYPGSGGAAVPTTITPSIIGSLFANPSQSIDLTTHNGVATTAMRSDGAPPLSQTISPTMTGNWTFNPTSGDALTINPASGTTAKGFSITQTLPNTGGPVGQVFGNYISVTDGLNITLGQQSTALDIEHHLTSNINGQKLALSVGSYHDVNTASSGDQIGISSYVESTANNGGTNTGAGSSGTMYGANFVTSALSGTTNYGTVAGAEFDISIASGATSKYRWGLSLVSFGSVLGATGDAAIDIAASQGSWKNAIFLENTIRSVAALATSGCVICTDAAAGTIATGIDLNQYTISGNFLNGPGSNFTVPGAGTSLNISTRQILSASVSGSTTPYANFVDTAGNLAFSAGGGGASPDPTNYINNTTTKIGNIGGGTTFATFATGATGIKFNQYGLGLLHSSAAGVISSSLVVSADLSITATTCTSQFLTAISATGVGSCTTATLASAQFANQGTTTTVLHGNGSGNPSFAAVSLTADITGVLAGASGGTGLSTAAVGDLMYASATTPTWSRLADVATGSVLVSGGLNTAPAWSAAITVTTSVTTAALVGTTSATSPLHIGGSGTTGTQSTFQTTTGNGTTDGYAWNGGNNGGTNFAQLTALQFTLNVGALAVVAPASTDANFVFNTTSTGRSSTIALQSAGSAKWQLIKQTNDSFLFYDVANSISAMLVSPGATTVGSFTFGYTTVSSSKTTGSVIINGGLGVAGTEYANILNATASIGLGTSGVLAWSATAPTIASGFGTSPSVTSSNGAATFKINVGTGGTATGGVVTMPTSTTGWNCVVSPAAAPQAAAIMYSVATSTTSITITNYTATTGVALAWTASTIIAVKCTGF